MWRHKTARVYGDLARWLAPGTVQAMQCDACLPRDEIITTFLVPPTVNSDQVQIPEVLLRFSKKFFPEDRTRPTVNLLRKWYHTELLNMTETHDALLRLMQKSDGQSASTGRNHYQNRVRTFHKSLWPQLLATRCRGPLTQF